MVEVSGYTYVDNVDNGSGNNDAVDDAHFIFAPLINAIKKPTMIMYRVRPDAIAKRVFIEFLLVIGILLH